MKMNAIFPGILMQLAITYRVYVKTDFILAVILLNFIFKIVIRQNRRGKSMIHTFTTQMNLKKGLQGKVGFSYPTFNFGRRTFNKIWGIQRYSAM